MISAATFELGQLFPLVSDEAQRRHLQEIHALLKKGLAVEGPARLTDQLLESLWLAAGGSQDSDSADQLMTMPKQLLLNLLRELATNSQRYSCIRNDNALREDPSAWDAIQAGGSTMDQVVDHNLAEKQWVAGKATLIEEIRYD